MPAFRPVTLAAIHQPHYLPWLRYFDKLAKADVFILLDDAQYNKNGWQNRNRIKGPQGAFLLTVPVHAHHDAPLLEVRVAESRFPRAHLQALRSAYGRMPGFPGFFPELESLLLRPWSGLVELNAALLELLTRLLGLRVPVLRSSTLGVTGHASERLAEICRRAGATHYLSGAHAASAYLDARAFERAGIGLRFHHWNAPVYDQAHPRAGFVADLSIVDLLAAEPLRASQILSAAGRIEAGA